VKKRENEKALTGNDRQAKKMLRLFCLPFLLASVGKFASAKVITDKATRNSYISNANVWFESEGSSVDKKDLFNGPPNPLNLETHQTVDCDFVEPTAEDPMGGTTPKFFCDYEFEGEKVRIKVKYDQQYNSVFERWGRPNEEVYASVVSQRLLWGMGFGSDHSVPVTVNCRNCPIEPWLVLSFSVSLSYRSSSLHFFYFCRTYIQVIQGYDSEDALSGWMDMKLVATEQWNHKASVVTFTSAIVYFKIDQYLDADEIVYYKNSVAKNTSEVEEGFGWYEMYIFPNSQSTDHTQMTARSALSVIASFISHVDNFNGNQGLLCLDEKDPQMRTKVTSVVTTGKTKDSCKHQPFLYIHDVGGTLGYGWSLRHKNFWPNYFDLKQVRLPTVF
jgi:hypothetical protein